MSCLVLSAVRRALIGLCVLMLVGACGDGESPTPATAPAATAAAPADDPFGSAPETAADGATALTQVSGAALPKFEQLEDDPAIGRTPPVVVGTDLLTGAQVSIESQGRPMVVAFYAHWCPHCQAEVAELTEWLETHELPTGVDFFAVSVLEDSTRDNHPPSAWLRGEGWQHPVVADTPSLGVVEAFGLASVPYLVVVDANNTVALRYAGNVGAEDFAALFVSLLAPAG